MSVSQKEAVYSAVKAFLAESGIRHDDGRVVVLNKDQRQTVINMISVAAMNGEMDFSDDAKEKYNTIDKMRAYCNNLLSNWLRKDTRLNGDRKFAGKSVGTRVGSQDEAIRNLKALRAALVKSTPSDVKKIELVDAEIQKRFEAMRTAKTSQVHIDYTKIPDVIRQMMGK